MALARQYEARVTQFRAELVTLDRTGDGWPTCAPSPSWASCARLPGRVRQDPPVGPAGVAGLPGGVHRPGGRPRGRHPPGRLREDAPLAQRAGAAAAAGTLARLPLHRRGPGAGRASLRRRSRHHRPRQPLPTARRHRHRRGRAAAVGLVADAGRKRRLGARAAGGGAGAGAADRLPPVAGGRGAHGREEGQGRPLALPQLGRTPSTLTAIRWAWPIAHVLPVLTIGAGLLAGNDVINALPFYLGLFLQIGIWSREARKPIAAMWEALSMQPTPTSALHLSNHVG